MTLEDETRSDHARIGVVRLCRLLAALTMALGIASLVGWAFDVVTLKSLVSGLAEMKPNTAACSVLGAAALWWTVDQEAVAPSGPRRVAAIVAGALAALIAGSTLLEYASGWNLHIDELVFRDPSIAPFSEAPGRMARNTAFSFLLVGSAFATWQWKRRSRLRPSHWLALLAAGVSLAGLVGYFFSVTVLFELASFTGMSVQTSLALLSLSIGALLMQPDSVLMRVVGAPGPGGAMARRMLPAILLLPLLIGWMRLLGERAGLIEAGSGVSAMVAALVLVQSVVLYMAVAETERLEKKRTELEEASDRSRKALRLSRERLLAAIQASEAAIFEQRLPRHASTYRSRRTARMLGFEANELPGKRRFMRWLFTQVHAEDRPGLLRAYIDFLGGDGEGLEHEFRLRHRDGRWIWVHGFTRALERDTAGRVRRFVGVLFDVTLEKSREAALRSSIVAADAANRAKTDFMATMSHELRTPLNAIVGYSDLLLAGIPEPVSHANRRSVERIAVGAQHLGSLIEEVLTFSGLDAGQDALEIAAVSIDRLVEEIHAVIEPLAHKRGLGFTVSGPDAHAELHTDHRKVRQILLNLLGNAVKFSLSGEVGLRVVVAGGTVRFDVFDTGPGIEPAALGKIFEPFWQADESKRGTQRGAGLGLAISRSYAEMLGGRLGAHSVLGKGSTFTLEVPLATAGRSNGRPVTREEAPELRVP